MEVFIGSQSNSEDHRYGQADSWQNPSPVDKHTPRSSDAQLQVNKLLREHSLAETHKCERANHALQCLALLFKDVIDSLTLRVPPLGDAANRNNGRLKLLISRLRIRNYLKVEKNGPIAVLESKEAAAITVTNDSYLSVVVECPLNATLVQSLCSNSVCMLLPRELIHLIRMRRVQLRSVLLEINSRSITLFNSDFQFVMEDVQALVNHSFYQCPHNALRFVASSASFFDRYESLPKMVYAPQTLDVVTQTLKLNKVEVSFLIGHQGTKIQELRQESGATIKIIPIAQRLTIEQLNRPASIQQHITITGNLDTVTKAVSLIDSQLAAYRL
ncbi:LADA_0G06876g1_1 [Lachancea dasiensis]|uniref:LADA_0G06876g1_1 n=1 Tax=Lachancea dasiensis TaxID=1072105 RepID=A0A1G4JTG0_9SACH|nr:LADA_0G06876g1_1 [Lachancea dasiensis]